jgi:hypothetical protein
MIVKDKNKGEAKRERVKAKLKTNYVAKQSKFSTEAVKRAQKNRQCSACKEGTKIFQFIKSKSDIGESTIARICE